LDGRTGQRYVWIQAAAFEFASCGILPSMRRFLSAEIGDVEPCDSKVDYKSLIALALAACDDDPDRRAA